MQRIPAADREIVRRIHADVQNPELRSLLLQVISDQRITENVRVQLEAHFTGRRLKKNWPNIVSWMKKIL